MNVTAIVTLLHHEGGSKFYQTIELRPAAGQPGRVVTITHWGKGTPSHINDAARRPVNGGQTQRVTGAHADSKLAAKLRRGYHRHDESALTFEVGVTFDRGDKWLIEMFGAAEAHNIHTMMFQDTPSATPAPGAAPDNEVVPGAAPIIETRPQSWGSW